METPITQSYVPDLRIGHLFGRSWSTFKDNFLLIVGVFFVYSLITNGLSSVMEQDSEPALIVQLIILIIHGPLLAGVYFVALRLIRSEPTEFVEMFEGFRTFGKAVGVFLIYGLVVIVGLLLLLVPGVIAAVGLVPAMFLVLDAKLGVFETLKKAWELTSGYRVNIFLVFLALVGLNLLGFLALIIGAIFTGAFSLLVIASLYEELSQVQLNQARG